MFLQIFLKIFLFSVECLSFRVRFLRKGGIYEIFARNAVRNSIVFRVTTNHTGENGDKKQNTLPYTLQIKVVEVCLVGAGDESRAFGGAPR